MGTPLSLLPFGGRQVSASIFRAWHCLSYAYDDVEERSFLAQDLAVRCDDSAEHNAILRIAWPMVLVWPIGMVAMYAGLLIPCRFMLLDQMQSSPLLRATMFLHRDYKPAYFWWEVGGGLTRTHVVACLPSRQRCCSTCCRSDPRKFASHRCRLLRCCSALFSLGAHYSYCAAGLQCTILTMRTILRWLILISSEYKLIRLVTALVFSICFLVAVLACDPYVRKFDYFLASGVQLLFVCIFIGGIFVRLFEDISTDAAGSPALAQHFLGLKSSEDAVLVMIGVSFAMIGLLAVTVSADSYMHLTQKRLDAKWSICTIDPPHVKRWRVRKTYACFLSHYKME
eukprot:4292401-Prymnesium_polylepis.2